MLFRRKETPWEVVDTKRVDPIPLFDELDDDGEYYFRLL